MFRLWKQAGGCIGDLGSTGLWLIFFVEGLFGHPKSVHRGGHSTVEQHLGDYFADLLPGYADMEGSMNMPLDHLGAVAQHSQGGDGAEAAGLNVDRRAVVYLAVDY